MNFARVLLGGLVAGLILNVGEFLLNTVVFAKQMEEMYKKFNVPPPGTTFMVIAVVITFLLGILLVWIYALARPRLGPGPKTALVAALIAWFCVYVYTGILNGLVFGVSLNLTLFAIGWGLVEYVLAAIAGAWVYQEA